MTKYWRSSLSKEEFVPARTLRIQSILTEGAWRDWRCGLAVREEAEMNAGDCVFLTAEPAHGIVLFSPIAEPLWKHPLWSAQTPLPRWLIFRHSVKSICVWKAWPHTASTLGEGVSWVHWLLNLVTGIRRLKTVLGIKFLWGKAQASQSLLFSPPPICALDVRSERAEIGHDGQHSRVQRHWWVVFWTCGRAGCCQLRTLVKARHSVESWSGLKPFLSFSALAFAMPAAHTNGRSPGPEHCTSLP